MGPRNEISPHIDRAPAPLRPHAWFEAEGHAERVIHALQTGSPDERVAASATLANFRTSAAEDSLIACLDHPNARVREAAASALGSCGSERCTEPLIGAFIDGRLSLVAVREAVGSLGPNANAALARLTRHTDPLVRSLAVRELGRREGDGGALELALADEDAAVRTQALLSLADRKAELSGAGADAVRDLSFDPDPMLRAASCETLALCCPAQGLPRLAGLRNDADPWVARCAKEALAKRQRMTMVALGPGEVQGISTS